MGIARNILKNTGTMVAGNLIFRLISLFTVVYLARHLSVADFGKYNFVFAYLGFFTIITDAGLGDIVVREMSKTPESMQKIVGNVYVIKIFLSIIAVLFSTLIINLLDYPESTNLYIYVASATLVFQSFSDASIAVFITNLKMKYDVISKIISKLVFIALVVYIIILNGTLLYIIVAFILSEFLRMLLNYAFSKKVIQMKYDIDFSLWRVLLKESLPIALSGVFLILYHRIDIVMLSLMIKGVDADLAVGLYSAAYKLSEPLQLISYSIVVSLYPAMSKSFQDSKVKFFKIYENGLRSIFILTLPIALGGTLVADKIILSIYDSSYEGSIIALQILMWSFFFLSINMLLTSLLTSINKQKFNTLSMGACVIINIVLNLLLIPEYSYNGASIATVITELVLMLMSFYFISKSISVSALMSSMKVLLIKSSVSCIIMGLVVYFMNAFTNINVFLTIISGALFYGLSLVVLGAFSKNEKEFVKSLLFHKSIFNEMR